MRLCAECRKRSVVPLAVSGRRSAWKHFRSLPIPADLEIPTCSNCGTEWIDLKTAERLDAALSAEASRVLSKIAIEAITALSAELSQGDLEARLGLSAGYASKLKHGKETPSPWLAALLSLLAVRPARLEEIERVWELGMLPPRITRNHFSRFAAPMQGAEVVAQ